VHHSATILVHLADAGTGSAWLRPSAQHRPRRPRASSCHPPPRRSPRTTRSATSPLVWMASNCEPALPTSPPRSPHPPVSPAHRKHQEPASSPARTATAGLPQKPADLRWFLRQACWSGVWMLALRSLRSESR
jgi:hypothetical protein